MEPEFTFPISELSHDSDILSLFNRYESMQEQPVKIQLSRERVDHKLFQPSDLNIDLKSLEKGYYSDMHIDQKSGESKRVRQPRQIINKKEKKKSKKRTRMYIEMLENRVQELQAELQKLRKLNKINKQYIHRLNESEHMINGYFVGRQQVYQKLENMMASGSDERQISEEVSSLRLRQGVFGKDRVKAMNYYFKEMVEMLLPQIQKYLVKSAQEESDMFNLDYVKTGQHFGQLEPWRRKMLEEFDLKTEVREYFPSVKSTIIQEKQIFDNMLEQFYDLKCSLTQQARKMEIVFDHLHEIMTPVEIARCLCYVDKYRFEKKLSVEESAKHVFDKLREENFSYEPGKLFITKT